MKKKVLMFLTGIVFTATTISVYKKYAKENNFFERKDFDAKTDDPKKDISMKNLQTDDIQEADVLDKDNLVLDEYCTKQNCSENKHIVFREEMDYYEAKESIDSLANYSSKEINSHKKELTGLIEKCSLKACVPYNDFLLQLFIQIVPNANEIIKVLSKTNYSKTTILAMNSVYYEKAKKYCENFE